MSEVNVYGLEKQKAGYELAMELRESALKLNTNRDFKRLILQHFMVNECALYAQRSADPVLTPAQRADALAIAQAAGHLKRFLSVIVQMGNAAEAEIPQLDEALHEARNQEDQPADTGEEQVG